MRLRHVMPALFLSAAMGLVARQAQGQDAPPPDNGAATPPAANAPTAPPDAGAGPATPPDATAPPAVTPPADTTTPPPDTTAPPAAPPPADNAAPPPADTGGAAPPPPSDTGDSGMSPASSTPAPAPNVWSANNPGADLPEPSPDTYPKPSPFPISWELEFKHGDPHRITVRLPGEAAPRAYWYIAYTVTNGENDQPGADPDQSHEQIFYPHFEMRRRDGRVIPSDNGLSPLVFEAVKKQVHDQFMEDPTQMGGRLLLGADQARDSVAIWPEPFLRMGSFTIFASGMWGETSDVKGPDGNAMKDPKGDPMELHKTDMISYHVDGDEYPGHGHLRKTGEQFIMR